MERLSTADALQFAIHCLSCLPCAVATEVARPFVQAMAGAARELRAEQEKIGWQCSLGSIARTRTHLVGACAQMRFHVTGYEPPRR
jgi:hypothetical protein